MEYRRLGRSGLQVSAVVLGTMNFGRPTEKGEALRDVFRERITQAGIEVGLRFAQRAQEKGHPAAQLAVAWVLHQPGITSSILGPRNLDQLENLLPAVDIKLTEEDLNFFNGLVPPGRFVVNYFNTSKWMK